VAATVRGVLAGGHEQNENSRVLEHQLARPKAASARPARPELPSLAFPPKSSMDHSSVLRSRPFDQRAALMKINLEHN
jgi:hypothetical protein